MRKAAILFLLITFLSASGAAELNSTISADSCPAGHTPILSMDDPDKPHNNPGTPSMYKNKVCVSGITEAKFGSECRGTPAFYLSSNNTYAHFSQVQGYNLKVCAGRMITRVRSSCLANQTALFSVSNKINGFGRHVAGLNGQNPKVFSNVVCGFYRPPENISVSLNFNLSSTDQIYFDDEEKTSEFSYSGLAEYPYIVSTSGTHTLGLVSKEFKRVERKLETKNILVMEKSSDSPSFFVTFTEGDQNTIEESQGEFFDGDFMNRLDPSFGFYSGIIATVRAILDSPVDLRSNLSISRGSFRIRFEKTGENQVTIKTE